MAYTINTAGFVAFSGAEITRPVFKTYNYEKNMTELYFFKG